MSVRRAQSEISAREFAEWCAFDRLDPIGAERADLRAGIIASTVHNVHRGQRQRPSRPVDFMPKFERRGRRQTAEEMQAELMRASEAFGQSKRIR
jgi:hypothetical protein